MFVLFFPPSFFSYQFLIVGRFNLWTNGSMPSWDRVPWVSGYQRSSFTDDRFTEASMENARPTQCPCVRTQFDRIAMLELTHRFRVEIISIGNSMEVIEHVLCFSPMAICVSQKKSNNKNQGPLNYLFFWGQTMQIYGNFQGIPL